MSQLSVRPAHALALATCLVASAFAATGCGSSKSSGTSADPATLVPASAQLYAGADVRPSGAEQAGAAAAGRALTHEADPYVRLLSALRTPGSPSLTYKRDVAPWLGPHAGVFLTSLQGASAVTALLAHVVLGAAVPASFPFAAHGAAGALVLDTSDTAKARAFLEAQAKHAGAHATSYRGVSYMVTGEGVALGVVRQFAVVGGEEAFHAVIDTSLGGAALAGAAPYTHLLADAPAGTLAHVFTSPAGSATATQAGGGGLLGLLAGSRRANISFVAAAGSLTAYADAATAASGGGGAGGLLASGAEGAQALSQLPGNSWLAVGLGDLGHTLGRDVAGLRELAALGTSIGGGAGVVAPAAGTLTLGSLVEGLLAPLVALTAGPASSTSWMGSGGLYASGSGVLELKGAIVIESHQPAVSRAAVAAVGALLHRRGDATRSVRIPGTDAGVEVRVTGLPLPLVVADGHGAGGKTEFVLGLGEASVTEALSPSSTMAASASRSAAAATLGEGLQPSLIFQVPMLLSLLEGVGLGEDPTLSKLLPLLRGVSMVTGGGHVAGEVERFKLVLSLAQR